MNANVPVDRVRVDILRDDISVVVRIEDVKYSGNETLDVIHHCSIEFDTDSMA